MPLPHYISSLITYQLPQSHRSAATPASLLLVEYPAFTIISRTFIYFPLDVDSSPRHHMALSLTSSSSQLSPLLITGPKGNAHPHPSPMFSHLTLPHFGCLLPLKVLHIEPFPCLLCICSIGTSKSHEGRDFVCFIHC